MIKKMKLRAYLNPYSNIKVHEVENATSQQLERNLYITNHEPSADYTLVGEVEAEVYLHQHNDIVGNRVTALRKMQTEMRARAEEANTRLEGEIQSLLSITMKKEA